MNSGKLLTFISLFCSGIFVFADDATSTSIPSLSFGNQGNLISSAAINGDRVADFSCCGYEASAIAIPLVDGVVYLQPSGGDDTTAIQQALDFVSLQDRTRQGWRGTVVLGPGTFHISNTLLLHGDHVVLRGSKNDSGELTQVVITGKSRRPAIIVGSDRNDRDTHQKSEPRQLANILNYAAVGATSIKVDNPQQLKVGEVVAVVHPSTQAWIDKIGMGSFPDDDGKGSWLNWKAGAFDQVWIREIVSIEGNSLVLDAPLTSSIDGQLSTGKILSAAASSNHHLGVEFLKLTSEADILENPLNEEHAWDGIRFCDVTDAWARQLSFEQFAGSAVQVGADARRVTVVDCLSRQPVSELAGWRRHTFFCLGQQSLFLRCSAEDGRHDFSTGPLTSGPNAFVYCSAKRANAHSGPIGSWATGVLFDNVEIDGNALQLTNLETEMAGTGWTAANCVLWNCVAPRIICRRPPTAFNLAVGIWGEVAGDGSWNSLNEFVTPNSLFEHQLSARLGRETSGKLLAKMDLPTSNGEPKSDWKPVNKEVQPLPEKAGHQLRVTNGWLTFGDRLAIGARQSLAWWRGSLLPERAVEFGVGLTRYVPGMDGKLFTNSIDDVVTGMIDRGAVALDHHWGLWYDRRRDDHQMVRRMNADVWPPFYEQPWARSGQGQAWDGLSRYDLTRFNHWYFERLAKFASAADQNGLILMQHMYFQHNILEAGAHWADFPWRPANCLQDTGFSEPPVYENRKRVFVAEQFYDISHPVRRQLHTLYIRHCLDTLGKFNNVVFVLGEEYTGPTHFVKFWLDTVQQWSMENQRDVLVMLSACRNVQEEILAHKTYADLVDIVDIKYWWHTSDNQLYDPPGGDNLAPRQQLRAWKNSKNRTVDSTCRSIRDIKDRFPEKAVVCSLPTASPWMLLAAGCSLPNIPNTTESQLLRAVVGYQPDKNDSQQWSLNESSRGDQRIGRLKVSSKSHDLHIDSESRMARLDAKTGRIQKGDQLQEQAVSDSNPSIFWLTMPNEF